MRATSHVRVCSSAASGGIEQAVEATDPPRLPVSAALEHWTGSPLLGADVRNSSPLNSQYIPHVTLPPPGTGQWRSELLVAPGCQGSHADCGQRG